MSLAAGSYRDLRYIMEGAWGTTPGTPTFISIRNTGGGGLTGSRGELVSAEMRSDRAITAMRLGIMEASLELPFELTYLTFEDWFEAALFDDFAAAYAFSSLTIAADSSAKTFTATTQNFETGGVEVGDYVVITGMTTAGNNSTFLVSGVTAKVITCSTATGMATEAGSGDETLTTTRMVLDAGTTQKFMSIEEAQTDISVFQTALGMMINTMNMTFTNSSIITGSFGLLGKSLEDPAGSTDANAVTAVNTNDPFDSFTGSITDDTVALAIATSLDFALANGLEQKFALFSDEAHHVAVGRVNLTGNISLYFEDDTYIDDYINESTSVLQWEAEDPDGNAYRFTVPKCKLSAQSKSVSENEVLLNCGWRGLYDSTYGTTFRIEKRPGSV